MPRSAVSGRASMSGRVAASGRVSFPIQQNRLLYSNTFDNAVWSRNNILVTPNAAANPLTGAVDSYAFVENTANSSHILDQTISPGITLGRRQSFSVFIKADNRTICGISAGNGTNITYFDLSNGTIIANFSGSGIGGTVGTIKDYGNGWYLCTSTSARLFNQQEFRIYSVIPPTTVAFTGNGLNAFYIYQAQVANADWTGPITPTTSTPVDNGAIRNIIM